MILQFLNHGIWLKLVRWVDVYLPRCSLWNYFLQPQTSRTYKKHHKCHWDPLFIRNCNNTPGLCTYKMYIQIKSLVVLAITYLVMKCWLSLCHKVFVCVYLPFVSLFFFTVYFTTASHRIEKSYCEAYERIEVDKKM